MLINVYNQSKNCFLFQLRQIQVIFIDFYLNTLIFFNKFTTKLGSSNQQGGDMEWFDDVSKDFDDIFKNLQDGESKVEFPEYEDSDYRGEIFMIVSL